MTRTPTQAPARPKRSRTPAAAPVASGPVRQAAGPVRTFTPAASSIVVRATPGCIHRCSACESHPCRLKGVV